MKTETANRGNEDRDSRQQTEGTKTETADRGNEDRDSRQRE